jgi:superfamily II DNA helicase RecQ
MVSLEARSGTLIERAANLVWVSWPKQEFFDHSRDKIIIYCRSQDEVHELANLLQCPSYTAKSRTETAKATILAKWIANPTQPFIIATSTLRIGFDYPHVRWVVHVDAPIEASSFSQESGQAGRDGQKALSIMLLWSR